MKRTMSAVIALGLAVAISPAQAADHLDGTQVMQPDASADITDVYAWMDATASKVNLVMNVNHNATTASRFNSSTQYVFHVGSHASFSPFAAGADKLIICTFAPNGRGSCYLGSAGGTADAFVTEIDSITGPEAGVANEDGSMLVYAGLRNDPFFFNLVGFSRVASTVAAVAGSLTFNAFGCPALDGATAAALVSQLAHGDKGSAPADTFAGLNVLSIVVQLDKALVSSAANPVISVWGSTNVELE